MGVVSTPKTQGLKALAVASFSLGAGSVADPNAFIRGQYGSRRSRRHDQRAFGWVMMLSALAEFACFLLFLRGVAVVMRRDDLARAVVTYMITVGAVIGLAVISSVILMFAGMMAAFTVGAVARQHAKRRERCGRLCCRGLRRASPHGRGRAGLVHPLRISALPGAFRRGPLAQQELTWPLLSPLVLRATGRCAFPTIWSASASVVRRVKRSFTPPPRPRLPRRNPAPDPERPLWKNLQLELDNGDPNNPGGKPAAEPRPRKPGLTGAVEVGLPEAKEDAAPKSPPPESPPSRRTPFPTPREEDDEDYGPAGRSRYRRELPRRDSEPHRGSLIMVLGIVSLSFIALSMCYGLGILVGLPLGITAWVLGSGDLRKIKNNEMDPEGLGMTQAGWICGIIGTCLHSLLLLTCGGFIAFILVAQANVAPQPRPMFRRRRRRG